MITLENILKRGWEQVNVKASSAESRPIGWLAFLNFLRFTGHPSDVWKIQWLEDFWFSSVLFPYWQDRFGELVKEVRWHLLNLQHQENWDLGLEDDLWPSGLPVFQVNVRQEVASLLENWLWSQYQPRDSFQIRVLPDGNQWLAFVWDRAKSRMMVHSFDDRFLVYQGRIWPLRRRFVMSWNSQGELEERKTHFWMLSPYVWVRLEGYQGLWNVFSSRGYGFTPYRSLSSRTLASLGSLYWRIKRIESFFIKKESDPLYRQLLAEADLLLKNQSRWDGLMPQCQELYLKVQEAIEWVWPDDPFLRLLKLNLEKVLPPREPLPKVSVRKEEGLWDLSDSTDSWPNAQWLADVKPMN